MIRKSVKRFSEKIMPKQGAKARTHRALAAKRVNAHQIAGGLLPFDVQEMVEPCAHGLLQIVTGTAEAGIALAEKPVLLLLQRAPGAWTVGRRIAHDLAVHRVDLAIEIGKLGIGADRLLDRAAGRCAVEARLARYRHQRAEALQLLCEPLVIASRGRMVGLQLDRGGKIRERLRPVAFLPPQLAAAIEKIRL